MPPLALRRGYDHAYGFSWSAELVEKVSTAATSLLDVRSFLNIIPFSVIFPINVKMFLDFLGIGNLGLGFDVPYTALSIVHTDVIVRIDINTFIVTDKNIQVRAVGTIHIGTGHCRLRREHMGFDVIYNVSSPVLLVIFPVIDLAFKFKVASTEPVEGVTSITSDAVFHK